MIHYIDRYEYDGVAVVYSDIDNHLTVEEVDISTPKKLKKNNGLWGKANHRLLSPKAEDEIISYIEEGYSPIDVAKNIGMSVSGLYRMLNRRGIPPRTARGRKNKANTIITDSGTSAYFNDYFLAGSVPAWKKIVG